MSTDRASVGAVLDRAENGAIEPTGVAGSGEGYPLAEYHETEPHRETSGGRLNGLRAGVLGANDGIVSTASIVLGVAGAVASQGTILTAGLAGLFAGALSMAAGEYVSVSSQRDAQQSMLAQERRELAEQPEAELAELTQLYRGKGLPTGLARQVAEHLTAHDALAAHAETELGIDPEEMGALTNPWRAALVSMLAFAVGAVFPLLAIALTPDPARVLVTVVVAALTLLLTGAVSAKLGKAHVLPAVVRNVGGGLLAMGVTYGIGTLVGYLFT